MAPMNHDVAEHLIFHGCADWVKEQVREYWDRKWKTLERLMTTFPPDQRHLRLTISRHDMRYEVRIVLTLPTGTLVATGESHKDDFHEAIDVAETRFVQEIRRHKQVLRRE